MATLLIIKEKIKKIYADYHKVIIPIIKAITAFLMLMAINDKIGYMQKLDQLPVLIAITIICAFMPRTFTVWAGFGIIMIHLSVLSLEVAAVTAAIFVVMMLLYLRFCSKDILLLVFVPLSFYFGIPYLMPLLVGVLCGSMSALTLGCGVIIHYYIDYISASALTIQGMAASNMMDKLRVGIDGIIYNEAMLFTLLSFAATTIVVHILRKQTIDYAWSVAIFTGAMTNVILNFMSLLSFDNGPSVIELLLGTIISVPLALLIGFLFMGLDYSRTEKVQFEDEDYYYYVKAVPKMKIQAPSKTIKKINTQKYRTHHR